MSTPFVRLMILGVLLSTLFAGEKSFAINEAPQSFALDGQIFQPGTTTPLLDTSAKIKVQILNPSKTCVLYEEQQTVNTAITDGYFNIQIGSVVGNVKRTGGDPGLTMSQVFQNSATVAATTVAGQTCPFNTYTPTSGDKRYFRFIITPSATNVADTQSPDMDLGSVPNALIAQSVQGLEKSGILQVVNNGTTALTQANLESIFTTPTYSILQSLLSGNYVQTGSNGASLPALASAPTSPPQGSIWYDSATHQVKYQNNVGVQTLGVAGAGVSATTTFGSTPNSAGLTISTTTINMEPADATNPGGVSTGAQTFAGAKTFSGAATFSSAGTGLAVSNNATVGGTLGVTGNTTLGGTLSVTNGATVGGSFQTNGNLYFSGTAVTNPMIKRSSAALEVKLGDDSGYTVLRAADPSSSSDVATKNYVDSATSGVSGKVAKSGDTMTGNLVMDNQKQIRLNEATAGGSNYVALQAPAALSADYTLTLPVDDGNNGEVLTTNGSGVLSWTAVTTGTVNAVGSFGSTPNTKGMTISSGNINLEPADATNPGSVSTGTQTFAGAKTFSGAATFSSSGTGLAVTNNATVGGTLGVTGNTTLSGTLGVTGNTTLGGTLGVTSAATFSSTGSFADNLTMANQKQVRFSEATAGGSNYVALQAPAALSADYTLTLPVDAGNNGEVLTTNGSGVLSWTAVTTGTVNAVGSFGSTPNTKGMTISSGNINLEPADATNPGSVSTGTQTFAGAKTFSGAATFSSSGTGLAVTNNATVGGTLGVTGNTTLGGTLGVTGNTTVGGTLAVTGATTVSSIKYNDGQATPNTVTVQAPSTVTSSYTLKLPAAVGNADQVLTTDASGNLSWTTPAVTSAVSVTAPITNSGTGAAPNISITQATTSTNGYLSSTDWNTFNSKQTATLADGKILIGNSSNVATAVSVTGDVAITNAGATTVNKIKGVTVSSAPTLDGQVLRYNGTNLVPAYVSMLDLRSTVTGAQALSSSCGASKTLTFNSATDSLACTDIAIANTQVSGLGTMSTATATDYLSKAGNLSGLADASTSRTNLGLGTMATATASDYLAKADNLSGLGSASTARTNLGLGTAATLNVGTGNNNIVQLDASAKLPAVDGSALTNLTATNISSGTLSASRLPASAIVDGGNAPSATMSIGSTSNQDFKIITNNSDRLTVLKGGNVGISTINS